ncbi:phage protein, HK97 gp10 family (plasmid) [Piscirickettsia salmonis]|uniref:HK97-gp10 family putative phage morphogenesis protein n=1 Tax=Piscirickettsia salmonis TaxID=1238 RepID=UPI0012BAA634|nr:HK97-gp10 family putative phage morphogenesis protein [Piscirickettsia salmonis]QGP56900.1 phage protein, HK97 gp10 family [Piscirickettsia salmonis]QGP66896.1 phage protein, HK97 gp10 family [Piscirickettsia salmonis]
MPKVSFSVEGLRELEQKLKTLEPKKIRSLNRRALRKAAEPVETQMKANAPQKSGALVESIKRRSKKGKGRRTIVNVTVGPTRKIHYAIEQEYGSSHQPARPFIRPALNDNAQKAINIFKSDLTRALKKQKL